VTTLEAMLAGPDDRTQRIDRISARARKIHFGRTVLALVALLLAGLGRLTFAAFAGVWLVLTWCAAAVAEGWSEAKQAQATRREVAD
jgi:hypothetical protein